MREKSDFLLIKNCYPNLTVFLYTCILIFMNTQSNTPKQNDGGKKQMSVATFRLPKDTLDKIKKGLGPFSAPSRLFRVLAGMYADGKIKITEEDIKKYGS